MTSKKGFSDFFRVVNNLFARKYNKRHKRRGQVVMDRFKLDCAPSTGTFSPYN